MDHLHVIEAGASSIPLPEVAEDGAAIASTTFSLEDGFQTNLEMDHLHVHEAGASSITLPEVAEGGAAIAQDGPAIA